MALFVSKIKNNKIFDQNMLNKKFNSNNNTEYFYSMFLKRKRIEKGMKLQEVASGICSISYLSRVENNQSIPSEDNLELLFERLDLNYNEIKRKRNNDVFNELLKNELSQKDEDMITIMSNIISSNAYSNIELDLFVLYESILSKNYEEARFILIRQEMNVELFNNKEMLFYLYLFCRYLFETNQNKRAYEQIKVLNSIDHQDNFMKAIIYDLSVEVAFMMGEYEQVIKFYYLLNQNEHSYLFINKINMLKLKCLVASANFNFEEVLNEFEKIKRVIDLKNEDIKHKYLYYLAVTYYKNNVYDKCLEIIKELKDYVPAISLYGFLVKKIGSNSEKATYLANVKNMKFRKFDYLYEEFSQYISLTLRNENTYQLYNFLKQKVLTHNSLFYDAIVKELAIKELISIGMTTSKYKETLRFIEENQVKS
jgi:transcriptional regulator with XRE-family HTH domain